LTSPDLTNQLEAVGSLPIDTNQQEKGLPEDIKKEDNNSNKLIAFEAITTGL